MRPATLRAWKRPLPPSRGALAAESLDGPHPHQGLIPDTKVLRYGLDLPRGGLALERELWKS